MISPIGYGSYNSYINSYYLGRNQGTGPVSAISPVSRISSGTASLLPLDTPQQARITSALRDVSQMYRQLKTASAGLGTANTGNAFDRRIVESTNTTALAATAKDKASKATYQIQVSQLAQSQQNTGTALVSGANGLTSGFAAGENTFSLTVGGVAKELQFSVQAGDSNKTALTNMASAINNAKFGVSAQVVDATAGGVTSSKLVLTAAKSGTDSAFSLADISGNAVAQSGAANQTAAARNAQYSVNGTAQTSQSNAITLDNNKVTVTLKAITTQTEKLAVKADNDAIIKNITEFAKAYNSAVGVLQDNTGTLSNKLLRDLTRSSSDNRIALADMGITVQSDKTLAVDQDKLEKALSSQPDRVTRLIGGAGGLASQVDKVTSALASQPEGSGNAIGSYPGTGTYQSQLNQYRYSNMSSLLSRMYSVGSLVDSYF